MKIQPFPIHLNKLFSILFEGFLIKGFLLVQTYRHEYEFQWKISRIRGGICNKWMHLKEFITSPFIVSVRMYLENIVNDFRVSVHMCERHLFVFCMIGFRLTGSQHHVTAHLGL